MTRNRKNYHLTYARELYRIPREIATCVGQLTAQFSYIEFQLIEIIKILSGITDPKIGRIILRSSSIDNLAEAIEYLVELEQIPITYNFNEIKASLTEIAANRNLYVHTVWHRYPSTLKVIAVKTRGRWPKSDPKRPHAPRRIAPEYIAITSEKMKKDKKASRAMISTLQQLHRAIQAALSPLPKKSKR